ncbi:hypothetical protein CALCODRAFT_490119 [Calocera cornea HHB12733]|uniref:Uncharacterized protein n=1 Tax=Calocera cornea HHB12733 TaxID=1353952 RepID=A0A165JVE1_9BASI|nr:hypothetical protein CALCODRAFT_490119 [Calocera cornea HHB12733]
MLVEYAYVDVFQADVEKCEMMQLAILEFSHALVPHLGKLAQLVEDYPPVTKIAGFEECMRRAAEYTPQEEASLTPTTPYSWQQSNRHPGLLHCRGNRGRRAEPDVELGAAVDSGNMEPHNETKDTSVLDEKSEQARALQHDKTSQRGETSIQHWVARNEQVSRGDQVPRLPRPGAEREPTAVETTGAVRA